MIQGRFFQWFFSVLDHSAVELRDFLDALMKAEKVEMRMGEVVAVVTAVTIALGAALRWRKSRSGLQNVRNPASAACRQGPNFVGRKVESETSRARVL